MTNNNVNIFCPLHYTYKHFTPDKMLHLNLRFGTITAYCLLYTICLLYVTLNYAALPATVKHGTHFTQVTIYIYREHPTTLSVLGVLAKQVKHIGVYTLDQDWHMYTSFVLYIEIGSIISYRSLSSVIHQPLPHHTTSS